MVETEGHSEGSTNIAKGFHSDVDVREWMIELRSGICPVFEEAIEGGRREKQ